FHTTGIHLVSINFYNCKHHIPHVLQLFRQQLYPATYNIPQTCATFSLLKQLHMLLLTNKLILYHTHCALEKMTCGTGLKVLPMRY
ncbi:hypothetical protein BDV98DRAFT_518620, partial [Pterulicium gracile]